MGEGNGTMRDEIAENLKGDDGGTGPGHTKSGDYLDKESLFPAATGGNNCLPLRFDDAPQKSRERSAAKVEGSSGEPPPPR
uniref:Uncharacterized protein n=1 Tax=Arundo donax TaxID=35708 RepID=A0A0A9BGI5_ARUDO